MMISILISTIDDRIKKVKDVLLPPRDDVEYIVSHQYTSEAFKKIPLSLKRSDVRVSQLKGKGVSRSRNNAMKFARGQIGLFTDDDVRYRNSSIDKVKKTFQDHPDLAIALFKIKTKLGEPEYKNYPKQEIIMKERLFAVSTLEIVYNIEKINNLGVCFDERFGLGNELLIGSEETIFLEDCLKKNARVLYVPEYIVEHPHDSYIKSIPKYDKRKNWVTGAYDCRTNGKKALIKAFLGTLKITPDLWRHRTNPFTYLYHRLSAVIYILLTNKKSRHTGFRWKRN